MNEVTATIRDRLAAIRFYDIAALAREVKGGTLGIDINRAFVAANGPIKLQFANWIMQQDWADAQAIAESLPKYEESSRQYYAKKQGTRGRPAKGDEKTAPVIENVPMPVDPDTTAQQEAYRAETERLRAAAQGTAPASMDVQKILDQAKAVAAHMDKLQAQTIGDEIMVLHQKIERLDKMRPILVTVKNGDNTTSTKLGRQHKSFNMLLKLAAMRDRAGNGMNIWLTGPAGSGKTTAAENVAKALNLPFHFTGAVDNEYKLLGFVDAKGKTVRTVFREAYEHGGIFLLDEVDGCHPGALLALNAALANGHCDFPDGNVQRHKDCVIMAAANTWGTGATHEYVGRTKLDSASLDRFIMLEWAYDEELEIAIAGMSGHEAWARKVQAIRARVAAAGIKHIVSPRATYDGAMMLADGFSESDVLTMKVRKGLTDADWRRIAG